MARKRTTVLGFLWCIGAASDDIPVTVKEGSKVLGTAKSLRWLARRLPRPGLPGRKGLRP